MPETIPAQSFPPAPDADSVLLQPKVPAPPAKWRHRSHGAGHFILHRTFGPRTGFTQDEPFKIVQLTGFLFGFATTTSAGWANPISATTICKIQKRRQQREVLAHEIIHQWWGLGATLADPDDPDWSDEGITVYTTYRLMRKLMGGEYAQTHYVDQWQRAMQNQRDTFYLRNPSISVCCLSATKNDIQASVNASNWYDGNALMIYTAASGWGRTRWTPSGSQLYLEGGAERPLYHPGRFLSAWGSRKERFPW